MNLAKDLDGLSATEKTALLVKLVEDVHESARIMQRGTSSYGIRTEEVPDGLEDIQPSIV